MPDPDFDNQVEIIETEDDEATEPEAKEIYPFMRINRGEDTLGRRQEVVFADFSTKPISADAEEDEVPELAPKAGSAPAPVGLEDLTPTDAPMSSETTVPTRANSDAGQASPKGSTSQTSS